MAKKRKKGRSLIGLLLDALLSVVDWVCEGIAAICMGVLTGTLHVLKLCILGVWQLVLGALRLLCLPIVWLWHRKTDKYRRAEQCLRLDGPEFEAYMALVLADNGYRHVEITKGSGDQGVDILAERGGKSYAIQCKNYAGAVGNFAVQEAYAGAQYYGCDAAVVVCPGAFTRGAKELAQRTGVLLWDGAKLSRMMKASGRRPKRNAKNA